MIDLVTTPDGQRNPLMNGMPGDDFSHHAHLFNDPGQLSTDGWASILALNQKTVQGYIFLGIVHLISWLLFIAPARF